MKNNSKNNFSNKDYRNSQKSSYPKNHSKSKPFSKSERNSDKNNKTYSRNPSKNKNISSQSNLNDVNLISSCSNNRNSSKISNQEVYSVRNRNYQTTSIKKNFDDWIWGKHSVFAALDGGRPINRIWCTSEIYSSEKFYILLKNLKSRGVLVEEVTWNRLSQLTFGATHQGIALQLAYTECLALNELINLSKNNSKNPIILALDGITDPHNLGAIIRSAEAFGCKGVILPQRRSAGLTGTVAKVAAGALEYLPVSRVVNLNRAIEELKVNGFLIIGLSGDSNLLISKFNDKSPLVVIVGAEDKGISLLTQKKCDYLIKIPLKGKTSSLNASVAAAISLFHLTNC